MLKTAFIGNENFFDRKICEWLSQHTDLSLIIWTNRLSWSFNNDGGRSKRAFRRFIKRSKRLGLTRAANEILYYILYRAFIGERDLAKVKTVVDSLRFAPRKELSDIRQVRPECVNELTDIVASVQLDAMFAMCIDVYLPDEVINAPRLGTFLWHEGITPNYRGVYSPFWALVNEDHENLGYTFLKMNSKLDAGEIYVQGKAEAIDVQNDWHSYIGHKAVLDSLPQVEIFLQKLRANEHQPIQRLDAEDAYYSYPTATALMKLAIHRKLR